MRIHRHRNQKPKLNIPTFRINEQIDNPEIRVIDDKDVQLGIIPTSQAMELARSRELDLVEVSPKAEPPVCKILDFGHFKYQKEKEVRKQKAQSHEVEIKGIRLSLRIGVGDLDIRRQQAKKFFERGVLLLVIGHHNMSAVGDAQIVAHMNAALTQPVDLVEEFLRVDHDAVADDVDLALAENARRNQV